MILKFVPILYAVIVKLFQLMIEKKSFKEISLVNVSRIPSGFFAWSTLEKIEVLHHENEEEQFSFWNKLFYSHHNVHFLTPLIKLNSNILFPIKEIVSSPREVVIKIRPLPQTIQIWGKTLRRVHDYGNGHELFDAIKDQPCVAWWRRWYFWTRHYLRTWHMC